MAVDVVNDLQVADRAQSIPAELIAELRRVGPQAIASRQGIPAFIRGLRFDPQSFLYAWQPSEILRVIAGRMGLPLLPLATLNKPGGG
ncbi:MAG: hypothetical protein HYR94_13425 [Chloroflexi bacterium]|nr:hypothetical protein [Chloroflexota bacterium]